MGAHHTHMQLVAFHLEKCHAVELIWKLFSLGRTCLKAFRTLKGLFKSGFLLHNSTLPWEKNSIPSLKVRATSHFMDDTNSRWDLFLLLEVLSRSYRILRSLQVLPSCMTKSLFSDCRLSASMWPFMRVPSLLSVSIPGTLPWSCALCPFFLRRNWSEDREGHLSWDSRGPVAHWHSTDEWARIWEPPGRTGTGGSAWATETEHTSQR